MRWEQFLWTTNNSFIYSKIDSVSYNLLYLYLLISSAHASSLILPFLFIDKVAGLELREGIILFL